MSQYQDVAPPIVVVGREDPDLPAVHQPKDGASSTSGPAMPNMVPEPGKVTLKSWYDLGNNVAGYKARLRLGRGRHRPQRGRHPLPPVPEHLRLIEALRAYHFTTDHRRGRTTPERRRREIVSIDRATGYDPDRRHRPHGAGLHGGAEVVEFDRDGGGMDGRNAVRVEVPTWQPGDADMGRPPGGDGAILPRVDHVRYVEPLTGLGKEVLRVREHDRDLAKAPVVPAMPFRTRATAAPIHPRHRAVTCGGGVCQPPHLRRHPENQAWLVML